MANVVHVTRADLVARREEILTAVGMTASEYEKRARSGLLSGDAWALWREYEEIRFLLSDG